MKKNHLKYYSSGFMGLTLFITLILLYIFRDNSKIYFVELFIVLNMTKDIVMHKLGYDFAGFGVKKMIIVDTFFLILFITYHISISVGF